jgi:hypothetical protein
MKYIRPLIIIGLIFWVAWAVFGFIIWNWNPKWWTAGARMICVASALLVVVRFLNNNTPGDKPGVFK